MINIKTDGGNGVPQKKPVIKSQLNSSLKNSRQNYTSSQKNVIPSPYSTFNYNNNIMSSSATAVGQTENPPTGGGSNSTSIINHRPRSGSTREQLFNAVEYYNSNVLRARLGAGLSGPRSSVNERHLINNRSTTAGHTISEPQNISLTHNSKTYLNRDHLYRSNSSLELLHDHHQNDINCGSHHIDSLTLANGGSNLRREYGSHGSIDVISSPTGTPSESFFAMLQDYRPAVLGVIGTDQRSPGPSEFLKGKVINQHQSFVNNNNTDGFTEIGIDLNNRVQKNSINNQNANELHHFEKPNSPKLKNKIHRLWGPNNSSSNSTSNNSGSACSFTNNLNSDSIVQNLTREQHNLSIIEDCSMLSNCSSAGNSINVTSSMTETSNMNHLSISTTTHSTSTSSADIEERQRRRAFAHFDCQSLTANLGYAAKLRGLLLARRRNTTTGASAASMMSTRSATPDADSGDEDFGDGQCNDLLENCPYFRNEIGGEEEREVSLTRIHMNKPITNSQRRCPAIHRPTLACGVSIIECPPEETLWRQQICPFQKIIRPIENVDRGASYYRQYFTEQDHQNWFGMDEQLGPVAISIKREKLPEIITDGNSHSSNLGRCQFRMIIRTSELLTLRGSIIEDSIPNPRGSGKSVTTKEVLEYVAPEVQLNCLRLGLNSAQCEQQLIKLDEQGLTNKYKVGILFCRAGQSSEEDMYNNEEAGSAFMEFLETVGKRVRLKGFDKYKAGLDNKTDSTGTHSLYAMHQDCEIMFHVSTMLPFTPNNRQQLLRKRHIGNDIVTIVFQEPGALPFTPKNIRSQFQHVFIIVRVVNPCTENTTYRVAVSRSKEVPVFGPPIPASMFIRGKVFAEFLLAKVINAENAAHRSEKFATMATRTRQEYLKDLSTNYCTTTVVDPGSKFSIFPIKKREKPKLRFSGDSVQRGAFCWQVVLQDSGLSSAVDCFLGISSETFVLIEECSRQLVFVTPTKSILGWSTSGNSLRIYHHQGECVTINMRDCGERDEQLEVIERLRSVTIGCGALELNLRRNPMGQLGFHVQPDGVVTQVETSGQAWGAGLRQGYRLVEICKIAVATLSHDQMVDLLKTSAQVTVTVIESFADYSPRRGCYSQSCKFNVLNFDGEYEGTTQSSEIASNSTNNSPSKNGLKKSASAQLQQGSGNHRRRYDRNFSPPRSSNSSGYGTGSSSRSFSIPNEHGRIIPDMGTLTSSSSGHSSNDDRWYDILENVAENKQMTSTTKQTPQSSISTEQKKQQQKLSTTNSLPINNANGSTARPHSFLDSSKIPNAVNGGNINGNDNYRPAPRMANVEYLITKPNSTNQQQQLLTNIHNKFHNEPPEILIKQITITTKLPDGIESSSVNGEPICNSKSIPTTDDEMNIDVSPQLRRSATTTNINKLRNGNLSSSSTNSSRNNSPRPTSEAPSSNSSVITTNSNGSNSPTAKLRPGVTNRNQAHLLQRNSVNYTSSSFQEDLLKLINPDYLSSDDSVLTNNSVRNSIHNLQKSQTVIPNSHSLGNISQISCNLKTPTSNTINDDILLKNISRSREAINLGTQPVPELKQISGENHNPDNANEKIEIIYTTARPATIISQKLNVNEKNNCNNNEFSQPKPTEENILHISEGGVNNSTKAFFRKPLNNNNVKKYENQVISQPLPLLPDPNDMDWSSLVDTATRAMMLQFQEEQRKGLAETANSLDKLELKDGKIDNQNDDNKQYQHQFHSTSQNNGANSLAITSGGNNSAIPEIQNQLSQLEDRILRETRRRKSLEHAVRRLTEENRRLQDESQAAVQQLRRFTEWFFQTIDRQS